MRHVPCCIVRMGLLGLLALPALTHAQEPTADLNQRLVTPVHGTVTKHLVEKTLAPFQTQPAAAPVDIIPTLTDTARSVTTEPGDLPRLKLMVDGELFELPLRHTHVKAALSGDVARVEVAQTYENPFAEPIETVYVFPLPENSAVDGMRMVIGDRVVEAEIKRKQEARQIYDDAKKAGHTAALLEQERPNIFTQSVANIAPHSEIKVVIRYVQDLTYDAGAYEFVFPMVVGPRFIPPGEATGQNSGDGWAQDTAEVGDASRITPPIVGAGVRTGHDISLELTADAGVPIHGASVPTHDVAVEQTSEGGLSLMLAEQGSIPNRDFVLRYKVASEKPAASVLTHKEGDTGYLALTLQPPALNIDAAVGQREFIFVVDVSGSMRGMPLDLCKDAMTQALRKLRPIDTFNIIRFESYNARLFDAPRPASTTNIREGMDFVTNMRAGGGTMLGNAVQEALTPGQATGRHRYVVFMTDAQIGNEATILSMTEALLKTYAEREQKARVFAFGMGASPNRYLIERIARVGQGAAVYASTREDPTRALNRFFALVDKPILQQVRIDWGDLAIADVYPQQLPDFFASRPLTIHARYTKPGTGTMTVKGRFEGQLVSMPVEITLPDQAPAHSALATLWARAKINELERDLWRGDNPETIGAITQLGMDHGIVTAYTSFVAVDRSRTVGQGEPKKIIQPTDLPDGVKAPELKPMAPPSVHPAPSQAAQGLRLEGMGAGGGGYGTGVGSGLGGAKGNVSGRGRGLKEKRYASPKLKPGRASVFGSLDKRIIKRGIMRHRNTIKNCYEKEPQCCRNSAIFVVLRCQVPISQAHLVNPK